MSLSNTPQSNIESNSNSFANPNADTKLEAEPNTLYNLPHLTLSPEDIPSLFNNDQQTLRMQNGSRPGLPLEAIALRLLRGYDATNKFNFVFDSDSDSDDGLAEWESEFGGENWEIAFNKFTFEWETPEQEDGQFSHVAEENQQSEGTCDSPSKGTNEVPTPTALMVSPNANSCSSSSTYCYRTVPADIDNPHIEAGKADGAGTLAMVSVLGAAIIAESVVDDSDVNEKRRDRRKRSVFKAKMRRFFKAMVGASPPRRNEPSEVRE